MATALELQDEVARLRALLEEQQARLEHLEGRSGPGDLKPGGSRSRRDLLRLAGFGLAGAAGASLLSALPAAAANGGNLVLGTANTASSDTSLVLTASGTSVHSVFIADATDIGSLTTGDTSGVVGIGLNQGPGLAGWGGTGAGGHFASHTGPDLELGGKLTSNSKEPNGTGRLSQLFASGVAAAKPPFTPKTGYGEIVRGTNAELWVSTASGWRRQNTLRVDKGDGSGNPFLPVRVLDTRDPSNPVTGGGPLAGGSTTTFTVAGTNGIPADAIGVVGNVTAAAYTGGGYLALFPGGIPWPGNSSLNFGSGFAGTGWGNSFTVGLGTGASAGKVSIYISNNGITTHVIMDATAFLQ